MDSHPSSCIAFKSWHVIASMSFGVGLKIPKRLESQRIDIDPQSL